MDEKSGNVSYTLAVEESDLKSPELAMCAYFTLVGGTCVPGIYYYEYAAQVRVPVR
jgi:hypothetical protein